MGGMGISGKQSRARCSYVYVPRTSSTYEFANPMLSPCSQPYPMYAHVKSMYVCRQASMDV